MIGLKCGIVELREHQTVWEENAAQTIETLKALFNPAAVDIAHVGSTAIKSIMAKPIIDIAVAATCFDDVRTLIPALQAAGFVCRPVDIPEEMYFVLGDQAETVRTHHVHVVLAGSKAWQDFIIFRDYLNAFPQVAKEYEALKLQLLRSHPHDRPAYTGGKAAFIKKALRGALTWRHLGRMVTVTVDRPLGSAHPRADDIRYPVNYGYVEGVFAGDGSEQDAYVLGVDRPVGRFTGVVAAVIHRLDDVEDKWVVVPVGTRFSTAKISNQVRFVERYFSTEIELARTRIIHILGAAGSGVSTLGKALSDRFGFTQLDTDDFFWMPVDPPFSVKRERSERQRLLAAAIERCDKCVVSGTFCGWGDIFMPKINLCIAVETPTDIRLDRLERREYERFGARIRPGGDMYEAHLEFIDWASRYDAAGLEQRSKALHVAWLSRLTCPVVTVDGTLTTNELLTKIEPYILP